MDTTNGIVFVFTVAVLGVLACGAALARTRREASAARAGLLSEVGDLLATAEDPRARLAAVAAAAVPAVADRCTIDLTGPRRRPRARRRGPGDAAARGRAGARPRRRRRRARGLAQRARGAAGRPRRPPRCARARHERLAPALRRRGPRAGRGARPPLRRRARQRAAGGRGAGRRGRAARGLRPARRDLRPRAGRARRPRPRPALRAHQRPHGRDQRAARPPSTSGAPWPRSSPRWRRSRRTCAGCWRAASR